MISRDVFDALPDKPDGSLKAAIVAFLKENHDKACMPQEINAGIGRTNVIMVDSTEPLIVELTKMVNDGTIQAKRINGESESYYMAW